MYRAATATVIVLFGAILINWLRNGATFHIAGAFPLLGGFEPSIYDLGGGVMLLIALRGVLKLIRNGGSS